MRKQRCQTFSWQSPAPPNNSCWTYGEPHCHRRQKASDRWTHAFGERPGNGTAEQGVYIWREFVGFSFFEPSITPLASPLYGSIRMPHKLVGAKVRAIAYNLQAVTAWGQSERLQAWNKTVKHGHLKCRANHTSGLLYIILHISMFEVKCIWGQFDTVTSV